MRHMRIRVGNLEGMSGGSVGKDETPTSWSVGLPDYLIQS